MQLIISSGFLYSSRQAVICAEIAGSGITNYKTKSMLLKEHSKLPTIILKYGKPGLMNLSTWQFKQPNFNIRITEEKRIDLAPKFRKIKVKKPLTSYLKSSKI